MPMDAHSNAIELILYACPTGPLADQLATYFSEATRRFSWNPAHAYMPHCSVTGFFHDRPGAVPLYQEAIQTAMAANPPGAYDPVIGVRDMMLRRDFHGLTLYSDWLTNFTETFVQKARSASRDDALRIKAWLHLSLAYEFPASEAEALSKLARRTVRVEAPVRWRLHLYQRHVDKSWTMHGQWPLNGHRPRA